TRDGRPAGNDRRPIDHRRRAARGADRPTRRGATLVQAPAEIREALVEAIAPRRQGHHAHREGAPQYADLHETEPPLLERGKGVRSSARPIRWRPSESIPSGTGVRPAGSQLFHCRHKGIMRCRGKVANFGQAELVERWRIWEALARRAKVVGLAKAGKDVG